MSLMGAVDVINRVFREFRRYTGDGLPGEPVNAPLPVGDPSSGVHSPKKSEIRAALLEPVADAEYYAGISQEWAEQAGALSIPNGTLVADMFTNDADDQAEIREKLGIDSTGTRVASRAWAIANFHPFTAPDSLRTDGYYAAGDGGGALYKKVVGEPSHAGKLSITLAVSGTVTWYELAERVANVLAFGARHTEANNAPMIQDAIDWACSALKGPVVFFPAPPSGQTYNITETISITEKVTVRGESIDVTIYATMASTSIPIFDIDGTVSPNLEDVHFESLTVRSDPTTRADAFAFNNVAYISVRDVILYQVHNGIVITGNRSFSNKFDNLRILPKAAGNGVRFVSFAGGGQHHFNNCTFCAETGFRLDADSEIAGLVFTSCNFEQCTEALRLLGDAYGVSLNGCYAEKNGSTSTFGFQPTSGNLQAGISVKGCFFETDSESYAILLGNAGKVEGIEIGGNYARDYTTAFIRFGGDAAGGEVTGNYVDTIPALYSNGTGTSISATGNRYSGGDRNT